MNEPEKAPRFAVRGLLNSNETLTLTGQWIRRLCCLQRASRRLSLRLYVFTSFRRPIWPRKRLDLPLVIIVFTALTFTPKSVSTAFLIIGLLASICTSKTTALCSDAIVAFLGPPHPDGLKYHEHRTQVGKKRQHRPKFGIRWSLRCEKYAPYCQKPYSYGHHCYLHPIGRAGKMSNFVPSDTTAETVVASSSRVQGAHLFPCRKAHT